MLKIEKQILEKGLDIVKISVSKRAADLYSRNILMEVDKDNKKIIFRSNNHVQETTYVLEEQSGIEIEESCLICIDSFVVDIIKSMSEGELKLSLKDGELIISKGRSRKKIAIEDIERFPSVIDVENLEYHYMPDNLIDSLKKSYVATDKGLDTAILGTYDINGKLDRIVTGDGVKLIQIDSVGMDKSLDKTNPPAELVRPVLPILSEFQKIYYYVNNLWTCFKGEFYDKENVLVSSFETKIESIDGEFPEAAFIWFEKLRNEILPVLTIETTKSKISTLINSAMVFYNQAKKENSPYQTNLHYENGELVFRMKIASFSEMKEYFEPDKIEGEDLSYWFDIRDFSEGINIMGNELVIRFYGKGNPFLIENKDGPPYITFIQSEMGEGTRFQEDEENDE